MPSARIISNESEIELPDSFRCPICGAAIQVDEISEWYEDDDGHWKAEAVKIDCVTFPGFDDGDAFNGYMSGHWSTPYIDWLPLERRVTAWVNARYSWKLD